MSAFNGADWLVVAAFVAVMLGVVLYSMRTTAESAKDYFFSGRDSNWLQIGTSIFSSNIGSEHLVGLAGAGFATGMAMAHWEIQSWLILVLGWVFVPLYDRMKVFTMPEFLELRFSRGSRNVLSLLTIASLVLTKIAVTIYAGDVVVRTLLGIDSVNILGLQVDVFWVIALGLAFTTGLYTVLGGLRVIMYTAVLQAPVLIFGSLVHSLHGLECFGSWQSGWRGGMRRLRPRAPTSTSSDLWMIRTGHGRRCCRAPRSSVSGTGAPTSTSCSACSPEKISRNRGAARFSPPS